jgi:protein-disulfide isomerase
LLWVLALAACTPLKSPASTAIPTRGVPKATATAKLAAVTPQTQPTSGDSNANCTVVGSILPTPNPTEAAQAALFKPVSDSDWVLGNMEAPITFLEYSDYQ